MRLRWIPFQRVVPSRLLILRIDEVVFVVDVLVVVPDDSVDSILGVRFLSWHYGLRELGLVH